MSQRRSIRRKLVRAVMTTTLVALLVSVAIIIVYDLRSYHRSLMSDLATQAELVGHMSSAALSFDDPRLAKENLALLRTRPQVRAAAIYDAGGELFAAYRAAGETRALPATLHGTSAGAGGDLVIRQRIVEDGETLGTVCLRAENQLLARTLDYLSIALGVTLLAMGVAYLLVRRMGHVVTAPIVAITEIARDVVATRDYSRRAPRISNDEAGELVDSFNAMPRDIERGMAAGFTRYLTKPIDIDRFTEAINSTLVRLHAKEAVPAERKAE